MVSHFLSLNHLFDSVAIIYSFIHEIEDVEAVKELKDLHDNIEKKLNEKDNLQWSVEPSSRIV